jgi:hypothetical protein
MGYPFDELAKALAVQTSRRGALKQVALSILAGAGFTVASRREVRVAEAAASPMMAAPTIPSRAILFNQICFNQTIVFNQSCPEETTATNDENKPDSAPPLTSQQRHQKERTNTSSKEDERLEGNVIGVNLDGQTPTITVANADGNVVVELRGDAVALAQYIRVGDYVVVVGEKQHELSFWATDLSVTDKKK